MKEIFHKILLFITGASMFTIINYSFDFVLYPFVLYKLGVGYGFAFMTVLSFLFCWWYFLIYDYLKKDFLGIEFSKQKMNEIIAQTHDVGYKKYVVNLARKSKVFLFVFLSIYFNPFLAVAFNREGVFAYNGLSTKDWRLFVLSLIISNGFWSTTVFLGLSFFEFLYKLFLQFWQGLS